MNAKLKQLTGKPVMGNTFVRFELMNCGSAIPRIAGYSLVVPPRVDARPNALGIVNVAVVNNDLITCDITGNTFYTVSVWNGDKQVFARDYIISGATMDLTTAVPITTEPTPLVPHFTYDYNMVSQGAMFWASQLNRMSIFEGNKETTPKVLLQAGDGSKPAEPYWGPLPDTALGTVPTTKLTGILQEQQIPLFSKDIFNAAGSAEMTVVGIQGKAVASTSPTNQQALVFNTTGSQYQPQAIVNQFNGRTGNVAPAADDYNFNQLAGQLAPTTQLPDSGATAGTYGATNQSAQITVDAKGRVTGVTAVTISGTAPGGVAGGDLAGSYPNPSVQTVGGKDASNVATATATVEAATNENTISTIVKRDINGDFAAHTVYANLTGNVTGNVSGTAKNITDQLAGDVTGATTATVVSLVGGKTATAVATATTTVEGAGSTGTGNLVKRDASGNFTAGMITANLTGNVTGNVSGTAASFTGSLTGDVTSVGMSTTVATVGGSTAAQVHSAEMLANAATNLNSAGSVVKRDASGNADFGSIGFTGVLNPRGTGVSDWYLGKYTSTGNTLDFANGVGFPFRFGTHISGTFTPKITLDTSSGTVTASSFSGALTGNVTGNVSGSAASFTGSLNGDVTGTQGATVVSLVGGKTASAVATATTTVENATNDSVGNALVKRDASGDFKAGTAYLYAVKLSDGASGAQAAYEPSTKYSTSFRLQSYSSKPLYINELGNAVIIGDQADNGQMLQVAGNATVSGFINANSATIGTATIASNGNAVLSQLQLGSGGPRLKASAGAFQLRNAADDAYASLTLQDLNVNGSLITINTETVSVDNNTILLNSSLTNTTSPTENAGVQVNRGNATAASLLWNEGTDKWMAGLLGSEVNLSLESHTHTVTGDVSATLGLTSVSATVNSVGGSTAANVHAAELLANAATDQNTASQIVKRDGSGNFTAGTITANLNGNASTVTYGVYTNTSYADPSWITSLAGSKINGNISGNAGTATALAADPVDCSGNNWARGVNASGTAQCAQPDFSNLSGTATAGQLPATITPTTITFPDAGGIKETYYNGYLTGIETETLYWRSGGKFRWYINQNADGGTSDVMELVSTGLTVSGTITATTFNGALNGNASTATNVAWTGVTGKPDNFAYADGLTYNLSISGNAATATTAASASSVEWTNVQNKPALAYADAGTYNLNISGNAATATTAGTANAVAWSNVTGRKFDCATYSVNSTQLTAGAAEQGIVLFNLPARAKMVGVAIKHSVPFTGGILTGMEVSVGTVDSKAFYSEAHDVYQPVNDAAFQDTTMFKSASWGADDVYLWFSSTGANVNVATAGALEVNACWVLLP